MRGIGDPSGCIDHSRVDARFALVKSLCLATITASIFLAGSGCIIVESGDSDDSANDESSSAEATEETGNPYPGDNVCEDLIRCMEVVAPEATTSIKSNYGEMGVCWMNPTITAEDCMKDCYGQLKGFNELFPDEPECTVCDSNSDCVGADGNFCTPSGFCIEYDECHPFDDPCPSGQACKVDWTYDSFQCVDPAGLNLVGDSCNGDDTCVFGVCLNNNSGEFPGLATSVCVLPCPLGDDAFCESAIEGTVCGNPSSGPAPTPDPDLGVCKFPG